MSACTCRVPSRWRSSTLVDLVVHPGGAVTTLGVVEVGVPQMVLPQRVQDEFFNAAAIAGAGAGLALVPRAAERPTTSVLASGGLLEDPSYRDGARQLGKELATMPRPPATSCHSWRRSSPEEDPI